MAYLRPRKPALAIQVYSTCITPLARHVKCKEILAAMSTWTAADNRVTEGSFSDRTAMVQHSLLPTPSICIRRQVSNSHGLVKLSTSKRGSSYLTSRTMHTRLRRFINHFPKLHHHHRYLAGHLLQALHRCYGMHYHPSLKWLLCSTTMFEQLLYRPYLHKLCQLSSNQ